MQQTPCAGWAPNVSSCSTWAGTDPGVQAYALRFASFVLWAATGRQFGQCQQTVRPCEGRREPLYIQYPASPVWALYGSAGAVVVDTQYTWCCGGGTCACSPSEITLPGPVAANAVTQVVIEGVPLTPTAYRLDGDKLVRQDGLTWPVVQDLGVPAGQPNTWSVTYLQGVPVPLELNDAAGVYACEVAKSRTGAACRLPQRVRSVSRQGVDITLIDSADWLDKGLTGVTEVDQMIRAVNPYGLRQPPRVVSLDMPQYR